ncbi:MAG: hypothetical protein V1743_00310 [Nanoarchaeota archaeon]
MRIIKTKRKLEEFKRQKKAAREILKLKIFEDVHEIKKLDKHIGEFIAAMRDDIKQHAVQNLREHTKEFEFEVHEELDRLIDLTKQDLELYIKVMKSLNDFKRLMKSISHTDPQFEKIAEQELKYAAVIHQDMHHKLATISKIFKRLRQ